MVCREYTLPRDEHLSEPKGWIRGNTEIGPVLEVTTCCLQGKYGVEIRIEFMNKDHSHPWVRISHGLKKLVTNLNNKEQDDNEQEISEMQCQLIHKNFTYWERTWIEPQDYSPTDYSVSKKLINLLRHGSLPREDDGAIEFWRTKDHLRNHFVQSQHWSDEKWKSSMAGGGGGQKKIFQYCSDVSGQEILYLRARQGHSGRNLIDPSSQDNVTIPDGFSKYIYHVGCAINYIPSSIQD